MTTTCLLKNCRIGDFPLSAKKKGLITFYQTYALNACLWIYFDTITHPEQKSLTPD
jgi:hypothetical protein